MSIHLVGTARHEAHAGQRAAAALLKQDNVVGLAVASQVGDGHDVVALAGLAAAIIAEGEGTIRGHAKLVAGIRAAVVAWQVAQALRGSLEPLAAKVVAIDIDDTFVHAGEIQSNRITVGSINHGGVPGDGNGRGCGRDVSPVG